MARTDTERLDFLIQAAFYGTIALELIEGHATNVQLSMDRAYIDNAMWRRADNIKNGRYSVEDQKRLAEDKERKCSA